MTKILALIQNGNLSVDEAIKTSSDCSIAIALQLDISQALHLKFPKVFQTSKDLKELEINLKLRGITTVYLHEKEDERRVCRICGVVKICHNPTSKIHPFEPIKKPLMLAVFGDTQAIKDVLDASSKAEGEDEIRRLLG